jgi:GR25 family glycosyltransferase involved in LPS biosynthesis
MNGDLQAHVITVDTIGVERCKRTVDILDNLRMNYKIHVNPISTNKIKGCVDSHMNIYREALNNNEEFVFIVEDNIDISPNIDVTIFWKNVNEFLNSPYKDIFSILYIGGFYLPYPRSDRPRYHSTLHPNLPVFETYGTHGTSAYIIHKRFYSLLLQRADTELAIDTLIEQYPQRFMLDRVLFYRNLKTTSIVNPKLDIVRNFYFSPAIYKTAEYLYSQQVYTYENISLFILIIILFILLCIYVIYKINGY